MRHPFDESMALTRQEDGTLVGPPPKAYWNMVGPFGGMTAAILLNGVLCQAEILGEPLVLTVNFCAPVKDQHYTLKVRLTRRNRSTQHWHVDMVQVDHTTNADIIVAQAMVVMGVRRDGWSLQSALPPPTIPPEDCEPRTGREGIVWFDRFDMRYVRNPMHDDPPDAPALCWVRDKPARNLDYLSLTNRCDALFPAIFAHRQKIDPIATVSFNVYFHTTAAELAQFGDAYTLGVSRSAVFHEGFGDSEAQMWVGDRVVASTHQVMWYRT